MPEVGQSLQDLLSNIVPDDISCAVALIPAAQFPLFPVEERAIAGAVPTRHAEFRAGRSVARMALAKLGLPAMAIAQAADRMPLWPEGVVGSIAHAGQSAVAMVARASDYAAIGFDYEPTKGFDGSISELLLRPDEHGVKELSFSGRILDRALHAFVIKEAGYKAIYPLTRRVIDFVDAKVHLSGGSRSEAGVAGDFIMEVLDKVSRRALPGGRICGRWSFDGDFVGALATMAR